MIASASILSDLGIILAVAGIASMIFQTLRQPAVLGYLAAGVVLGPHAFTGLRVDVELTHRLAELGVILLMFSIGLEFRLRKLLRVGLSGGVTATIEVGLMITLGYLVGQLFGWTAIESLFAGGCLGISSTMLVARAFAEQGVRGPFVETTYAVLIFEDILAILLIVILTAVASGRDLAPADLAITLGRLLGFLLVLLAAGLLIVPRVIRAIARAGRAETLLVVAVAICFVMATMAEAAGYSVALGAFLAGILVAESGESHAVESVIGPLRDIFAAIFFISTGTLLDPTLVLAHWPAVLVLSAVVLVGKVTGVSVGSFLAGNGLRRSVRAGMSLAQIGEFAFIIASLGWTTGATREFLLPVAVAVSCVTALTTPWMIRSSEAAAAALDKRLPRRLQTLTSFYEAWIEALRERQRPETQWAQIRRGLRWLAIDVVFLVVVIAAHAILGARATAALAGLTGVAEAHVSWAILGFAVLLGGVFFVGVLRRAQRLGEALAALVLPRKDEGGPDLGRAPRRVFAQILEVTIALVLGLPLIVILHPFLPFSSGAIAFVVLLGGLGIAAWRSASNFQGHVRAGTELVVEVLARQGSGAADPGASQSQLSEVVGLLPGFPDMEAVPLAAESPAVGRTLAELNLRAITGASVMAITRAGEGVVLPSAGEVLRDGDVLALAGAHASVQQARALLLGIPVDGSEAGPLEGAAPGPKSPP
ncbi:MAG: cation:proton antiporter [Nannocystaceae bacterium]